MTPSSNWLCRILIPCLVFSILLSIYWDERSVGFTFVTVRDDACQTATTETSKHRNASLSPAAAATAATTRTASQTLNVSQDNSVKNGVISSSSLPFSNKISRQVNNDKNEGDLAAPKTTIMEHPSVSNGVRQGPLVQYGDSIYLKGDWDGSPVVIEKYKLVFFTSAKVACTVWKHLFRKMEGFADWHVEEYDKMLPWNPETNGLKYLYDYNRQTASRFMTSPEWTRAIFIREPKERFLSAYLDKAVNHKTYLKEKCCWYTGNCVQPAKQSPAGFLKLVYFCNDAHWKPQSKRMEAKYWPHINFVGHLETLQQDAKELLTKLGAWEAHGKTGWGESGNLSIFATGDGRLHTTNAANRLRSYLKTPELIKAVEDFYAEDYAHPVLNITKIHL